MGVFLMTMISWGCISIVGVYLAFNLSEDNFFRPSLRVISITSLVLWILVIITLISGK